MEKKSYFEVMIVGLGGQGALFIGRLLAEAALSKYKNVSFLPNYGAQMRMGPSECTTIISDEEITSPVTTTPEVVILMGAAPLQDFEGRMAPGSTLILDSSVLQTKPKREDLKVFYIPATRTALKLGNMAVTNLVLLGAYLEASKVVPIDAVEAAIEERMAAARGGIRRPELLSLNKAALREGARLMAEHPRPGKKRSPVSSK